MKYIIVQAGGKGTRLKHLTRNKPKALVPVKNLPMLFHLFRKYPDKNFIIIADYKKEVLHEYLEAFAHVRYQIVDAEGEGTCAGVKQAVCLMPENEPFLLIWSDLILPDSFDLPLEYRGLSETERPAEDYIGISQTFSCRWSYSNGRFWEEKSYEHGVAGFFLFTGKEKVKTIPRDGEMVRWMQESGMTYREIGLGGTEEFGTFEEYSRLEQERCRPFNKITINADRVIKESIDEYGKKLASRECAWYDKAKRLGITTLPNVYRINPLELELIEGKNIYEDVFSYTEKKDILRKIVISLRRLHKAEQISADTFSCKEVYFLKTIERIRIIRDMIPFANQEYITVNGRKCRNVFFCKRELEHKLEQLTCDTFCFIHGDCTFSNILLRKNTEPVFIDPRGYFGQTELYGDPRYDWAKLYYSIVGNYDHFNRREFDLKIDEKEVLITVQSNKWEELEDYFFELTGTKPEEIKLLHAVIWLSLTTYAWHDYDSVCGAFYLGIYYLEEVL